MGSSLIRNNTVRTINCDYFPEIWGSSLIRNNTVRTL